MTAIFQPMINNVKNRFLPYPESAIKGLEPEAKITDFEIIKELGSGSFGHVFLVIHKITRAQYAIKAIDKRNKANITEKPYFRREIEIMYKIHHPNVVKLFGHFEDDNYCYFVMEYISKGNIYSLIPKDKRKRLSSQVIASLMKDLISAVYFLHHMKPMIVHRDIKPENVMLAEGLVAKLTDFGWSNYMTGYKRTTVCGTPIYLAPEIINETGHNEKVDHWCIGVLLFELCTGSVPFKGNDIETLKYNIRHMLISWPREMNPDARDLIMKILKYDPAQRISLEEMLKHPFFTKYFPNAYKSLIKPDDNVKYKPFIISKDNPKTWDPITGLNTIQTKVEAKIITTKVLPIPQKARSGEKPRAREISPTMVSPDNVDVCTKEKFIVLQEKYEMLKKEYCDLKTKQFPKVAGDYTLEMEELKKQIKDRDDKIIALSRKANGVVDGAEERELKSKFDALEQENKALKTKVEGYEKYIKEQHIKNIDNKFKELRETFQGGDKEKIKTAYDNVKARHEEQIKKNFMIVLNEKDKEILKCKEEEKLEREKDKKKYTALIEKYDTTLNWFEKDNKELKAKIKDLEAKVCK